MLTETKVTTEFDIPSSKPTKMYACDIPNGQIFTGRVAHQSEPVRLFQKRIPYLVGQGEKDPLIVPLDRANDGDAFTMSATIYDYRPVKTLKIEY